MIVDWILYAVIEQGLFWGIWIKENEYCYKIFVEYLLHQKITN